MTVFTRTPPYLSQPIPTTLPPIPIKEADDQEVRDRASLERSWNSSFLLLAVWWRWSFISAALHFASPGDTLGIVARSYWDWAIDDLGEHGCFLRPPGSGAMFQAKNAMCCTFLLCRVSVWFVMLFNEQCDFKENRITLETIYSSLLESRQGESRYNVEIDLFRRNNKKIQDIYDFTWGTNNKAQTKESGLWCQELAPGSARNLQRSGRRRDGKKILFSLVWVFLLSRLRTPTNPRKTSELTALFLESAWVIGEVRAARQESRSSRSANNPLLGENRNEAKLKSK